MTISAILVMFAVIWFMTLFVVLPIGLQTQEEAGEVVPGTHASAPADANLKKKCLWVTLITIPIWILVCGIIVSGWVTMDMFDIYKPPVSQ